jgi:hypothetical protein
MSGQANPKTNFQREVGQNPETRRPASRNFCVFIKSKLVYKGCLWYLFNSSLLEFSRNLVSYIVVIILTDINSSRSSASDFDPGCE